MRQVTAKRLGELGLTRLEYASLRIALDVLERRRAECEHAIRIAQHQIIEAQLEPERARLWGQLSHDAPPDPAPA